MGCGCIQTSKKYENEIIEVNKEMVDIGRKIENMDYTVQKTLDELKKENDNKKELINAQNTIIQKLEQIQKLKEVISQLEINLSKSKSQFEFLRRQKDKELVSVQTQTVQFQDKNKVIEEIKKNFQHKQEQYKSEIRYLTQNVYELSQQLKKYKQMQNKKEQPRSSSKNNNLLFRGTILLNQEHSLMYLVYQIELNMYKLRNNKQTIKSTKLLYTSQKEPSRLNDITVLNKRQASCVIIMKIKRSDNIVAGWTEYGFQKQSKFMNGLILQLKNMLTFQLRSNKTAAYCEGKYVIFGNSELRINFVDKLLLSNLGIQNSYYDAKGYDASNLLGSNQIRQVELETIEIYQLTV